MGKPTLHPQGEFFEGLIKNATDAQATTASQVTADGVQRFYMTFNSVEKSQEVKADCAQITFLNLGTATVVLNGVPLPQYWFFSSPANWDELDVTQYKVIFSGAGTKNCIVIRKNRQE